MTHSGDMIRKVGWAAVTAAVILSLTAPYVLDSYWVRVVTTVFMFGILASAINLVAGYTGYPAFGNVVFFGLGAYSTAVGMTRLGLSFSWSMGLGVAVSGIYAVSIGLPVLRLRGHYFAIATLGMNEATRAIVDNLSWLTGGGMGLSVPTRQGDVVEINRYFYFVMLAILMAVILVSYWMDRSRFGYGCRAIRFDEEAAASCGVPTTRYKITAWVLSAVFTSMVGSTYAHWFAYIEPTVVFDMATAVKMFVMMLLGGAATVFGPLLGAFLVEMIGHLAWTRLLTYHSAVFALIIIVVVIFIPKGFVDWSMQRFSIQALWTNVRESRL